MPMAKADKTLAAVFADPINGNIDWREIESMLLALGVEISEGSGSAVRFRLNGVRAVFHRPHPRREAGKGLVKRVRQFLTQAGVRP